MYVYGKIAFKFSFVGQMQENEKGNKLRKKGSSYFLTGHIWWNE